MNHLDQISEELRCHVLKMSALQNSYRVGSKLVKELSQRKMWKLLRYVNRANPSKSEKTLYFVMMCGRRNRTPWKCKGLPYVLKAERLRLHAEAIKLFEH